MKAVNFGVPQKRKRVVIIGTIKENPEDCFPEEVIKDEKKITTTEDAIGDLFDLKIKNNLEPLKIITKPSCYFQEFARGIISPDDYINFLA